MFQKLDLSQRALSEDGLAEDIGNLLDGDRLGWRVIRGGSAVQAESAMRACRPSEGEIRRTKRCHMLLVPALS